MTIRAMLIGALMTTCGGWTVSARSADIGTEDVLRISEAEPTNGLYRVAVDVINDEALVGMDIPLRFGQPGDPVELVRVEFAQRVDEWDVKHASIDNTDKTVIIGLISELASSRQNAGLDISGTGNCKIADLVFQKAEIYDLAIEPFTTERPGHSLTYIYNRIEDGKPYVEELSPRFEVALSHLKVGESLPEGYALSQNVPNPFNPATSFTLSLPRSSNVTVKIRNVGGQLVRTLSGYLEAGNHEITWDGKDDRGIPVASGVYFYSAEADGFRATKKMIMIR